MKLKLMVSTVKKIPMPESGKVIYWDTELPCFGVKATPTTISYIVQTRAGKGGRSVTHFLGKVREISFDEARIRAMKALANIRDGVDLNAAKERKKADAFTLSEAYEELKKARQYRPKTLEIYDNAMLRCLKDWLDKPVLSITKEMVQTRHKALSNINSARGTGEAQANQCMRVLRTVLNYAALTHEAEDGTSILPENPVKRLSQAKAWNRETRRQDVIRDHQLKPWYEAVLTLDSTMRDYLLFLVFTGLRRREAGGLMWSDVDLVAKTLTIPADRTKNHKQHQLPLTDYLVQMLQRRKKLPGVSPEVVLSPFVFPGEKAFSCIVEPKRQIKKVVKQSGVKFFCHSLRRTFISIAERLDVPYLALKNLLNHIANNDVTAGYVITETERLREPMQKITNRICELAGINRNAVEEKRA